MRIEWIRGFLAVAERSGFRKAVRDRGTEQSGLSRGIRRLETHLGTKLFHRDRSGTQLSTAGAQFLDHADKIVKEVDEAERAMRPWRDAKGRVLRVGHTPGHREAVVEAVIAILGQEKFSDLRIVAEELQASNIGARVLDGRLDLGLAHGWNKKQGIAHAEVAQSPLRLVVNPMHRLAGAKRIERLDELAQERFVLTLPGRHSREIVDDYLDANGFAPELAVETNAMTTALALVREMPTGITLLSVPAPHRDTLNGLPLIDLPATPPVQLSFLLWREPTVRSDAARAFQVALRHHLGGAKDGNAIGKGGDAR